MDGHLADAGGTNDQQNRYIQQMSIISNTVEENRKPRPGK